MIDLTGKRIGKLTVLGVHHKEKRGSYMLCRCDCGGTTVVARSNLTKSRPVQSCGCLRHKRQTDLVGERFGKLVVVSFVARRDKGNYWKCLCDCGGETVVCTSHLRDKINDCGCEFRKRNRVDMLGKRFGQLVVIKEVDTRQDKRKDQLSWLCRCDCGGTTVVRGGHLRNHHTTSCGCLQSKGEEAIVEHLNNTGYKYQRQFKFPDCCNKLPLPFDFGVFMPDGIRVVEYHGEFHYNNMTKHPNSKFFRRARKQTATTDPIKEAYCCNNGIPLLVIPFFTDDVCKKLDNFLLTPMEYLVMP